MRWIHTATIALAVLAVGACQTENTLSVSCLDGDCNASCRLAGSPASDDAVSPFGKCINNTCECNTNDAGLSEWTQTTDDTETQDTDTETQDTDTETQDTDTETQDTDTETQDTDTETQDTDTEEMDGGLDAGDTSTQTDSIDPVDGGIDTDLDAGL